MQVTLKNVRLVWPSLFEAREQMNGGFKYEAQFLFGDDANVKAVKDAMLAVAKETWKDKHVAVLKAMEKNRRCLRNGDENFDQAGNVRSGYEGQHYLVAKSSARPTVVDGQRRPLTAADGKPYAGCYVNAIVDIYAMSKVDKGGNGIFADLKGVQFVRDGDAFGGGSAPVAADAFEVVEETADDDADPLA